MFKIVKTSLFIGSLLLLVSCQSMRESTKKHSPEDTAKYSGQDLEMEIAYCQPYKKDRLIFGTEDEDALVPYGEKWRTGANEATEITLSSDVNFGGKPLEAGTYSLYTIPGLEEWEVVINSKTDYWGASFFGSPFDEDKDVLRVKAPVQQMDEEIEQFTIEFEESGQSVNLQMFWDQTMISVPISRTQ